MTNQTILKQYHLVNDYMNRLDQNGYRLIDLNMIEPFHLKDKHFQPSSILFERNEQMFAIRSDWTRTLLNYNENFLLEERLFGYFGPVIRDYQSFNQAGVELYDASKAEIIASLMLHLSFVADNTRQPMHSMVVNNDFLLDLYLEKYKLDDSIKQLIYEKNLSELRKELGKDHRIYQLMAVPVSQQYQLVEEEFGYHQEMQFIKAVKETVKDYKLKVILDLSFRSPQTYYNGFYFQVFLNYVNPLLSGGKYNNNAFGIALNLSDGGLL